MSRKKTLQNNDCTHINQVKEWGWGQDTFGPSLWICGWCGKESKERFYEYEKIEQDHSECEYNPCFGCKARKLQISTGDANSAAMMPAKKFNKELDAYKEARKQGIQPNGTTMDKINAAYKASEALGKAYDGNTMISADKVTSDVAKVMKEIS